jgi:hypothetical protein
MLDTTRDGLKTALLGLVCLVVPAALTLASVRQPGALVVPTADPSPLGYTISLLLFIIPDAVLIWWLVRHPEARIERLAFWSTVGAVFVMGCVLDFFLAYAFFFYSNTGATLGIRLPAYAFGQGWLSDVLPIEEFGFYSFGALFMMGLYVWADLSWMPKRGRKPQEQALSLAGQRLWKFHWQSVLVGLLLIAMAIGYHKHAGLPGWPGYFIFLMCIGFIPTSVLFPVAEPLINWPAFTVMFLTLQLVSLLWEASVAVPYNWWNYHHDQMLGVFIGAWASLPIESVIMWLVSGWAVVIAYEVLRVFFHQREATLARPSLPTLPPPPQAPPKAQEPAA